MRSVVGAAYTSGVALANESGPVKSEPVVAPALTKRHMATSAAKPTGKKRPGAAPKSANMLQSSVTITGNGRHSWCRPAREFTMRSEKDDDEEPSA